MLRQRYKKGTRIPAFIEKLNHMLQNPENSAMVEWTDCHSAFTVLQPNNFSKILLPRYFKHKNYSSFLRQLNMYNFTKLRSENESSHLFQHPLFQRGDLEKHRQIRRRDQMPVGQNGPKQKNSRSLVLDDLEEIKPKQSLSSSIKSLKKNQGSLMQKCTKMISENNEVIEQNFILKATIGDESLNNRIIMDTISNFILYCCQQGESLNYYDSHSVTNLLQFLQQSQESDSLWGGKWQKALHNFIDMVQQNQMKVVLKWINSAIGNEKKIKKKRFTIVGKEGDSNGLPSIENIPFFQLQNSQH